MRRNKIGKTATRRKFLKTTAATGAAATGVAAFGGSASGQERRVNVDASQLQVTQQTAEGLINVQLSNLIFQDLVRVRIGRDVINLQDANIQVINVEDNEFDINIAAPIDIDVVGNQAQVAVTLLGETTQGQQQEVQATGTDVVEIIQTN